ncbi:hypothetical protein E2C01_015352 [Portunus trituberculatus]|uniref:Uncharacterized protein n=1 Tax=Portunus trituberculatus TaxID=210409 RepID=A0A5B7DLE3_PORTR|nr:hypothetical protein [Portunus trituberculatus]
MTDAWEYRKATALFFTLAHFTPHHHTPWAELNYCLCYPSPCSSRHRRGSSGSVCGVPQGGGPRTDEVAEVGATRVKVKVLNNASRQNQSRTVDYS